MKITENDFDCLTQESMIWDKEVWATKLDRFEDAILMPDNGLIFWVDNYASIMFCRQFCEERGFEFYATFDGGMLQWCFVTNFVPVLWAVDNA
jgi:hypothetical protein